MAKEKNTRRVKGVAKELTRAYAQFIKFKVREGDQKYINIGLDGDIYIYERVFQSLMSGFLGVKLENALEIPDAIRQEVNFVLNQVNLTRGFGEVLAEPVLAECVFEICKVVLYRTKEDVYGIVTPRVAQRIRKEF